MSIDILCNHLKEQLTENVEDIPVGGYIFGRMTFKTNSGVNLSLASSLVANSTNEEIYAASKHLMESSRDFSFMHGYKALEKLTCELSILNNANEHQAVINKEEFYL